MFGKRIAVLKQAEDGFSSGKKPPCAVCRTETENETTTVFFSPIGFSALTAGTYLFYAVLQDKTIISRDLGAAPSSVTFTFRREVCGACGFNAGVWTVKGDIPLLVAYGKSEDADTSRKDYCAAVINDVLSRKKSREKEFLQLNKSDKESAAPPIKNTAAPPSDLPAPDLFTVYNDEAVATENYYASEQKTEEKSAPFYLTVKEEIEKLFSNYPEEPALKTLFPDSRWAKIFYAEEKFYVVGVIKEDGAEKYVCYGVPSPYKPEPPKELAGYCSFIPLSVFDLKGDGYFMMFQDALTGECVRIG